MIEVAIICLSCLLLVVLVCSGCLALSAVVRDVLLRYWEGRKAASVEDMEKVILNQEKRIATLEAAVSQLGNSRFASRR